MAAKKRRNICTMEVTDSDIFVVFNGVRIAKRGHPSPQAKTWVSLEPGFKVVDETGESILIEQDGVRVH